jgi:hypothetical protein
MDYIYLHWQKTVADEEGHRSATNTTSSSVACSRSPSLSPRTQISHRHHKSVLCPRLVALRCRINPTAWTPGEPATSSRVVAHSPPAPPPSAWTRERSHSLSRARANTPGMKDCCSIRASYGLCSGACCTASSLSGSLNVAPRT